MTRERLVERVAELEPVLTAALAPLHSAPLVTEIRSGLGLLAAVELDAGARAADPGLVDRVVHALPRPRRPHARARRPGAPDLAAVRDLAGGARAVAAGMAAALAAVAAASPAAAAV